ncbi:2930_t:CDS:2 [Diversispora eburnea]|uniref:2930_t:CDS:1 n=1 Tax=Diversispora eburnea TaxID=1213867 RepID=A0A9N9GAQ5_9GLOM|nr:2930_t:CDS:2 [Diversispora eburnea]
MTEYVNMLEQLTGLFSKAQIQATLVAWLPIKIREYLPGIMANHIILGDEQKLQKLINLLLESVHQFSFCHQSLPFVKSDDSRFSIANPVNLKCPAYDIRNDVSDMISLKQRIGQYDLYNVRMYFGGGLVQIYLKKKQANPSSLLELAPQPPSNTQNSYNSQTINISPQTIKTMMTHNLNGTKLSLYQGTMDNNMDNLHIHNEQELHSSSNSCTINDFTTFDMCKPVFYDESNKLKVDSILIVSINSLLC